jgi:hypothetical protein
MGFVDQVFQKAYRFSFVQDRSLADVGIALVALR